MKNQEDEKFYSVDHVYWIQDNEKFTIKPYLFNNDFTRFREIYSGKEIYSLTGSDVNRYNAPDKLYFFAKEQFKMFNPGVYRCDTIYNLTTRDFKDKKIKDGFVSDKTIARIQKIRDAELQKEAKKHERKERAKQKEADKIEERKSKVADKVQSLDF